MIHNTLFSLPLPELRHFSLSRSSGLHHDAYELLRVRKLLMTLFLSPPSSLSLMASSCSLLVHSIHNYPTHKKKKQGHAIKPPLYSSRRHLTSSVALKDTCYVRYFSSIALPHTARKIKKKWPIRLIIKKSMIF